MDLEIPLRVGDSNYLFSTVLLGKLYFLSIRLNITADLFIMGVYSASRRPIVTTIPLFPNIPLGLEFAASNPDFPRGFFFLYDERSTGERPDIETLGVSYKLIFRSLK